MPGFRRFLAEVRLEVLCLAGVVFGYNAQAAERPIRIAESFTCGKKPCRPLPPPLPSHLCRRKSGGRGTLR